MTMDADGMPTATMSVWTGVAYVVGTIIGSGIYSSPGEIFGAVGSGGAALGVWGFGGAIGIVGALCYVELAIRFRGKPGGEAMYLREVYGDLLAFVYTFSQLVVVRPTTIALICVVFGINVNGALGIGDASGSSSNSSDASTFADIVVSKLAGVLGLLVLAGLNIASITYAARLQNFTTIAKVACLVIMVLWMIPVLAMPSYGEARKSHTMNLGFTNTTADVGSWSTALMNGLWAYDGWNVLAYLTDELQSPSDVKRCIVIGMPLCTVVYILANLAYFVVLDADVVAGSKQIAVDFFQDLINPDVGSAVACCVVAISTFGAANGTLYSAYRLVQGAAVSGSFSASLSSAPRAIVFQTAMTLIYVLFLDFDALLTVFGVTQWTFYLLTVFGVVLLRRQDAAATRSSVGDGSPVAPDGSCMGFGDDSSLRVGAAYNDINASPPPPAWWCESSDSDAARHAAYKATLERTSRVPLSYPFVFAGFAVLLVISPAVDRPVDTGLAFASLLVGIPVFRALPWLRRRFKGRFIQAVLPLDPALVDPELREAAEMELVA